MKIIKNYLWNVSYQIFVLIIPFLTIPYIARVIGPEGVGINSFTNSIIQYFILFGSLGFTLYGNREIAYVRDNKKNMSKTFWEVFFMKLLTMLISIIVFFFFLQQQYSIYLLMQFGSLLGAAIDISWFFMGVENFKVTVLRNLLVKIASVILIFTLVKSSDDLAIYIAILSFSVFFSNLTLFPYLKKYVYLPKLKELNLFKHLKPALILFVPQISINIYVVLNKTMLGFISGYEASGFFDQSDKIIKLVLTIVTSLGVVMLPHVANAFSKNDHEGIKKNISMSIDFVLFLSTALTFGLMSIAKVFAIWFLGWEYEVVGSLLMIQCLAIPFMSMSNVIGTQYLLPAKKNKEYTVAVTLGAVVNLILNFPLIYLLGAKGAAISSVCSELAVVLYELIVLNKTIKIKELFDETFKFLIAGSFMFVIVFFLSKNLSISVVSLFLEITVGTGIYILGVFLLKPRIAVQLKKIVSNVRGGGE